MTSPRLIRWSRWTLLLGWAVCCAAASGQEDSRRESVLVGIEGHYRVGRWTGVRLDGQDRVTSIETRDGDGVQVEYEQSGNLGDGDWGYLIPGSEAAPLILRDQDTAVVSSRFPTTGSPSRGAAMIPRGMPWIVALGDPLGVDQIGANQLLGRDAQIAVSMPKTAAAIPDSVLGYDGIDMMILGGSGAKLLASLSEQQQQAIADWITDGGRVFLTLGQSAPELLKAAPWLQALLPVDAPETVKIDPSAIETFTSSQTPLEPFVGLKLPKDQGRILIKGRTTRRIITPIAVDYNVGFGRVTVIAADLDDPMFAQWPERLDLITQLTGTLLILDKQEPRRKTRATAYDDLAGQMRATLDQFAIKRNYAFSIVSLILMALIAAIGPLDYLLVNRVFGRPLLGWLSFPLVVVGMSVLLAWESRPVRPADASEPPTQQPTQPSLRCNRIEIVDIDSIDGVGRGFTASYLYAHDASRFDLEVRQSPSLQSICEDMQQMKTTPLGYAGESFGGIQISIEDGRLPIYQVPRSDTDSQQTPSGVLRGLPLASRSSKGVATQFRFQPKLAAELTMGHRPGSELLQGPFVNPLPFDLLDGMLVYRNWAYLLPTRFLAGQRIERIDSLRQKNFRWRLSRQKALESATETEDWNPARTDSPQRISEMLMFHRAVGGSRYTSLRHEPLSFLDLSHVLADDRCMLIARIAEPMTEMQAISERPLEKNPEGQRLSLIRVVLPVNNTNR